MSETPIPNPETKSRSALQPRWSFTVILSADIARYTERMEQAQEETARDVVHVYDDFVTALVRANGGRIFKKMGDGVLVAFSSVRGAVEAALGWQNASPEDLRGFRFRIGIHAGDVLPEADDFLGTNVNIASRIQSLCDPGGILISKIVLDLISDRPIATNFSDAGTHELKHLASPIHCYSYKSGGSATHSREATTTQAEAEANRRQFLRMSSSTVFFSERLGRAFPGLRDITEFSDPEECVRRLGWLLESPLTASHDNRGATPFWWFRGHLAMPVEEYTPLGGSTVVIDHMEYDLARIVAVPNVSYFRSFLYLETKPLPPAGPYRYTPEDIVRRAQMFGFANEEYCLFEGEAYSREEFDDGAAVRDGRRVVFAGRAALRWRPLTPFNVVIVPHASPLNNRQSEDTFKEIMDGILSGTNGVEDLAAFAETLPKHRMDS